MKNKLLLFSIALLINALSVFSQQKTVLGEFCYYEQVNGQKISGICMPYISNNFIEIKFKSGYQITLKDSEKQAFANILKQYKTKVAQNKILLGEYNPKSISGNPRVKGKYSLVIDTEHSISIYYDGKKLIIEIPELKDSFGSGSSSSQTIFIPKNCVNGLLECLKKS